MSIGIATPASQTTWYGRLGHPSFKIFNKLVQSGFMFLSSSYSSGFVCSLCLCNKSHRLPFGESTLQSRAPLDLLYTDVWGPSPVQSVDGYNYYVIFVDHFTTYIWLYPLRLKSDVFTISRQFKTVVEIFFHRLITSIYFDGGGEYTANFVSLDVYVFLDLNHIHLIS